MVLQCPRFEKNNFKKTRNLTNYLNRKFKCNQTQIPNPVHPSNPNISRPQLPVSNPLSPVVYVREKEESKRGQAMHLSIEDLANWLANPEIKNNPTIINKKVPKTNIEWFDLMEESSSKRQKKIKVSQPIEEDFEAEPGPTTRVYRKEQRKNWRKETPAPEIIDQRDKFEKDPKDLNKKVPWLVLFPNKEWHWEVWQNSIQYAKDMFKVDGTKYAFSTWFIDTEEHKLEAKMTEEQKTKRGFKIIDKYEPIHESKKAGRKYIRGNPNVILTKKMKPGFWVGIDEKFLVRKVSGQSEVEKLDSNAHFDQAKREHGLTKIRQQKINDWEKKMHIPGAQVHDVAELEKILKQPITLLDITHSTIFNSKKYRLGNTWEAINNVLQGPQAIWLMRVGDKTQRIFQFVLEDESLKVVDLVEQVFGANHAGSRLANEINEWYPISGKINDDIKFFKFASNIHPVILVWYGKHFACQGGDGCIKEKGWALIVLLQYLLGAGILEDLTIGEVIISLTKQTKVWLPNNRDISCAIIDKGELDFLIKDCTDAGTFA
ncbi:41102_t:CDS:2, partial [Gigaspora margarita]